MRIFILTLGLAAAATLAACSDGGAVAERDTVIVADKDDRRGRDDFSFDDRRGRGNDDVGFDDRGGEDRGGDGDRGRGRGRGRD